MITDRHIAFARAMVALAREHGMNNLNLTFNQSHGARHAHFAGIAGLSSGPDQFQQVQMFWSEGRHGDTNRIQFKTQGSMDVPERAAGDGA